MIRDNQQIGKLGEAAIVQYLQDRGFSILATNYQTRLGEVDIIAQLEELMVFVEVKTRTSKYFQIASVVTKPKQRRIIAATKGFLLEHRVCNKVCRFDVATVLVQPDESFDIEYFESAFYGE